MNSARILASAREQEQTERKLEAPKKKISSAKKHLTFDPDLVCRAVSLDGETLLSIETTKAKVDSDPATEITTTERYIVFECNGKRKTLKVPPYHALLCVLPDGQHVISYSNGSSVENDSTLVLFNLQTQRKIKTFTHDLERGLDGARLVRIVGLIGNSNKLFFPIDNTENIQLRNENMELVTSFCEQNHFINTVIALPHSEFLCGTREGWIRFSARDNSIQHLQTMPKILIQQNTVALALLNDSLLITGHRFDDHDEMQLGFWQFDCQPQSNSITYLGSTPKNMSRIECVVAIPGTPFFITVCAHGGSPRVREILLWDATPNELNPLPRHIATQDVTGKKFSPEYPPLITRTGAIVSFQNEVVEFPQIQAYLNSLIQTILENVIFPRGIETIVESYCHFFSGKLRTPPTITSDETLRNKGISLSTSSKP